VLIAKRGTFRWALWGGWIACTLGLGLFLLLKPDVDVAETILVCLVVGLGDGMLLITLNIASQVAVGDKDAGYAVSFYTFMRNFGAALGLAIGTAAFNNRMQTALESHGYTRAAAKNLAIHASSFVDTLVAMPASQTKSDLVDSYVQGFHGVWYALIAIAGFSTLCCGLVRHHSLDRKLDSDHRLETVRAISNTGDSTTVVSDEEAGVQDAPANK